MTANIVIFRNDDLSALSSESHEREVAALFRAHRIPQTFSVIPYSSTNGYHNPHGCDEASLAENAAIVSFLRTWVCQGTARSRSTVVPIARTSSADPRGGNTLNSRACD